MNKRQKLSDICASLNKNKIFIFTKVFEQDR